MFLYPEVNFRAVNCLMKCLKIEYILGWVDHDWILDARHVGILVFTSVTQTCKVNL